MFSATIQIGPNKEGFVAAAIKILAAMLLLVLFPAISHADNSIVKVALSTGPDYSRLSFTFKEPMESYVLRRDDVDRVTVEFKSARLGRQPDLPQGQLIKRIELSTGSSRKGKNEILAAIQLSSMRYEVRHFASRDKLTVALDFKDLEQKNIKAVQEEGEAAAPLIAPTLAQEAMRLLEAMPPLSPDDGPETNLFRRALGRLEIMDNAGAEADLKLFLETFPKSALGASASYILAELNFASGPPEDTYAASSEMWKTAFERWPDNELALRGRFMEAEAERLSGRINEAAAKFKILAEDAVDEQSIYKGLALLNAVDLLFGLGLIDEGRALLEPVLEKGKPDRLGLEAYVRVGMADFYQGFFSQANEIFMEALKRLPSLYLTYPEMLYAAGEGYHYLNRPDLSRQFLFHALNLMPLHPKADVIMARIGDDYRREGRDREAMAIYGAAKRDYPDGDGGLISQVRLAEMGALHSFFSQDKVFDALERGSRQATVEMYKKIAASGSSSPLMQLAQLKIGTALAEDGENSEAIKWLRDIEINNPRSALLSEALPELGRALVQEVALQEELEDWKAVTDLWADNSSYLSDADRAPVMRSVAGAYERLGQPSDARDIWKEMNPPQSEARRNRYMRLVDLSLELSRPMDALGFLREMAGEFPADREWMGARMNDTGRALAKPADAKASANLVNLVESTDLEPARKTALADAIEMDINGARYDNALQLINRYRLDYPDDELSKEYILSQAAVARYQKKAEQAWDYMAEFRRLYPDDPRAKSSLKEQINEAEELQKDDAALKFMAFYRAAYPDESDSRLMLLRKMRKEWELERYADSDASFAAFMRDYPDDPETPELMHQRALDDWDKGRRSEAKASWTDLRRLFTGLPLLGKSYVEQYRRAVAAGLDDEARELVAEFRRDLPGDPAQTDLMLEEAKDLLAAGKGPEAIKTWNRFRETYPKDPRNPDLLLIQARQEMKTGQSVDALRHYREILDKYPDNPRNPDIYLELAAAETNLNRQQDAREHLNQFNSRYRNHPKRPKALLEQAELSRQLGLNSEAVNLYRIFRAEYPQAQETPATYLAQSRLEIASGQAGQAARTLEEGTLAFPSLDKDNAVQSLLTQLYLDDGQVEKWAAVVERTLLADGAPVNLNDKFFKYNQLAQVYQKLGRPDDAERNFDAALANKPADLAPESLYAIAKAYKNMNLNGKYAEVLKILTSSNDAMWKSVAEKELAEVGGV